MLKKLHHIFLISLSICILFMFVACSSSEKITDKSKEQMAQEISKLWIDSWNSIPAEEKEMLLPQGKIFLADLNNDKTPELFFITPELKDSTVTVFDIGKDQINDKVTFKCSAVAEEDELVFSVFDGEDGKVLHSESHLLTGFADPTVPITDYYVTYDGKKFNITTLYRIESKEGNEIKYFESPYDGTEITEEEYNKRQKTAEKNGHIVDSIIVSGKDIEFLEEDNLQTYVLSLLTKWETENESQTDK